MNKWFKKLREKASNKYKKLSKKISKKSNKGLFSKKSKFLPKRKDNYLRRGGKFDLWGGIVDFLGFFGSIFS
ncbi:MAG: hypothetical protein AAGF07_03685 [Patescibacteria group bacterium]